MKASFTFALTTQTALDSKKPHEQTLLDYLVEADYDRYVLQARDDTSAYFEFDKAALMKYMKEDIENDEKVKTICSYITDVWDNYSNSMIEDVE